MTTPPRPSRRHEVPDTIEAIEFCYQKGWTDGLPVVPPAEARVKEFLKYAGREPDEIIGTVPVRRRVITAEKVAINAVMAGCLPDYMPVVLAAVEAITDEAFNLHGSMASTGGSAPLIIISGPIAKALEVNSSVNLFGPGWRANATIGRALRLILMNVCGAIPGVFDKSTFGHPGKYSYCIAENEAESPWEPLHVDRGFSSDVSAVTVWATEGPHQFSNHGSDSPEGILQSAALTMIASRTFGGGEHGIILGGEHIAKFRRDGWSKRDVKSFLFEKARQSVASLKQSGRLNGPAQPGDQQDMRPVAKSPDDLIVLVGGGGAGGFSVYIPPWADTVASRSVTRSIGIPVDCR